MNMKADYTLPVNLTDESFDNFIGTGVRVIYVKASWCGPCRMMGPVIDDLAREQGERTGVLFGKVDADDCIETCLGLKVRSVPTTLIYKNGTMIERRTGVVAKPVLWSMVESLLGIEGGVSSSDVAEDF